MRERLPERARDRKPLGRTKHTPKRVFAATGLLCSEIVQGCKYVESYEHFETTSNP